VESKGRGSRPRPKSLLFFYVGVLTTSPPPRSVINSRTAHSTDLISPRSVEEKEETAGPEGEGAAVLEGDITGGIVDRRCR